ncbi:MAG: hypothetical protein ACRD0A_19570 [Acidimicrobiales bacterium]
MNTTSVQPGPRRRGLRTTAAVIAAAATATLATLALAPLGAGASVEKGGRGLDVLVGADNDNVNNTAIQPDPAGAKQHLDNTDLLTGSLNRDLLIGRAGSDTLLGEEGGDILIGGLEGGTPNANSDVLVGGSGGDINIWAPGDGSDLFDGGSGRDVMILAPIVNVNRDITLFDFEGQQVPRVNVNQGTQFCTIERAPTTDGLNVDAVVRFRNAAGALVVTIRLVDVEQVLCISQTPGQVGVADIDEGQDEFVDAPIADFDGVLGAVLGNDTSG